MAVLGAPDKLTSGHTTKCKPHTDHTTCTWHVHQPWSLENECTGTRTSGTAVWPALAANTRAHSRWHSARSICNHGSGEHGILKWKSIVVMTVTFDKNASRRFCGDPAPVSRAWIDAWYSIKLNTLVFDEGHSCLPWFRRNHRPTPTLMADPDRILAWQLHVDGGE